MIALNSWTASAESECCNSCGRLFGGEHIAYFEGSRVCTDCFTELDQGRQKISAAERDWDEHDDDALDGARMLGSVLLATAAVLVGAFIVWVSR